MSNSISQGAIANIMAGSTGANGYNPVVQVRTPLSLFFLNWLLLSSPSLFKIKSRPVFLANRMSHEVLHLGSVDSTPIVLLVVLSVCARFPIHVIGVGRGVAAGMLDKFEKQRRQAGNQTSSVLWAMFCLSPLDLYLLSLPL